MSPECLTADLQSSYCMANTVRAIVRLTAQEIFQRLLQRVPQRDLDYLKQTQRAPQSFLPDRGASTDISTSDVGTEKILPRRA